jgi:hypothetical protein
VTMNATKVSISMLLAVASASTACREHQQTTGSQSMSAPSASNQLADLATRTGLTIPPTAQLIGIEDEDRGEQYLRAKLVLNATDWSVFSSQMPVAEDSMDRGTGGFLGQDKAWWDPHAAQGLRTGQAERKPGTYLNIGIDDSDPDAVSVYIVQHGT